MINAITGGRANRVDSKGKMDIILENRKLREENRKLKAEIKKLKGS